MSLTKQQIGDKIGTIISKSIVILLTIFGFILYHSAVFIWTFRMHIYKGFIIVIGALIVLVYAPFPNRAYAPVAKLEMNGIDYSNPVAEYIIQVFGNDAPKAFKLLKGNGICGGENGSLNPYARNYNNDQFGSIDYGVFQINDHWQGVSNSNFLFDYKINVLMAHNIYTRDNNSFKLWTGGRCQGI